MRLTTPPRMVSYGCAQPAGEKQGMEEILLPKFDYYLDESDPDVLLLRRQDDSFVAAFSVAGVTKECIIEAAKEDYRTLLEAHAGTLSRATEQEQSA
jgi:hypothetical protein